LVRVDNEFHHLENKILEMKLNGEEVPEEMIERSKELYHDWQSLLDVCRARD